jgi:hypothetical protein
MPDQIVQRTRNGATNSTRTTIRISRADKKVFTPRARGRPFQVSCVGNPDPNAKCYIKYWELDYRSNNQKKFVGLQRAGQDGTPTDIIVRGLLDIRRDPIQSVCENSKPYFAVRAVFESRAENTAASGSDLTQDNVNGPWRFVGFWVSACGGDTGGDQRYIYMNMEVGTASVCKELAEVRSKNSNQDAAFTDRVWRRGDFREPGTGLQYSDSASPFSSAINTGPAGIEPLFQSGSEITGFSPLNPPTFLAPPSQTYYRPNTVPADKWAYLSNLFARIYRVYRFQFLPVSKADSACTDGPFKGTRCVNRFVCSNNMSQACPTLGEVCSGGGTCISTAPACAVDGACALPLTEDENIAHKSAVAESAVCFPVLRAPMFVRCLLLLRKTEQLHRFSMPVLRWVGPRSRQVSGTERSAHCQHRSQPS